MLDSGLILVPESYSTYFYTSSMKGRIWASRRATGASHARTARQLKTTISLLQKNQRRRRKDYVRQSDKILPGQGIWIHPGRGQGDIFHPPLQSVRSTHRAGLSGGLQTVYEREE